MSENTIAVDFRIQEATDRESAFGFLSFVFLELPNDNFVERMQEAGMLAISPAEDAASTVLDLGRDRARLLRATGQQKVKLPYESQFSTTPLTELFGELQEAYAAQGVHVDQQAGQPLDYIGIEFSFLELLAQKEKEALAEGDREQADRLLSQQEVFFERHLAPWLHGYGEAFEQQAQTEFYKMVGCMIAEIQPFGKPEKVRQ